MSPTLLLTAAVVLFLPGVSQAAPGAGALERYHVDAWSSDQGLPQNTVQALAQTRDGYLWAGTQSGLARFDGVRFTVFDRVTSPALKEGIVLSLLEDSAGRLWVGTFGAGLLELRGGKFVPHPVPHPVITAMVEDAEGALWLGTGGGGVVRYRGGQARAFTQSDGLPGDYVRALGLDATRRRVWIGYRTGGLGFIEKDKIGREAQLDAYSEAQLRALTTAADGSLWIGTGDRGVLRLGTDGALSRFGAREGLPSDRIYALHADADGQIWVGTSAGLGRIRDGRGEAVARLETEDATVFSLLRDAEGNLWAGTSVFGLLRLMEGTFLTFTEREGLGSVNVLSVHEGKDGTIWAGGARGGLTRLAPGASHFEKERGLPTPNVCAIHEDAAGTLWVGTWSGAWRKTASGWQELRAADGLPSDWVCSFAEHEGALWLGTSLGLARFAGGKLTTPALPDFRPQQSITTLFTSLDDTLWVGTQEDGLAGFKGGQRVGSISKRQGLGGNYVSDVVQEPGGAMWIGLIGGGVGRYLPSGARGAEVLDFSGRPGVLEQNINALLDDGDGQLWLCGTQGITAISKSHLLAAAALEGAPVNGRRYTRADGLNLSECNASGSSSAVRSRDGRMWFATVGGLAMVDPRRLLPRGRPPPVLIEALRADRKPVDLQEDVVLAPGTRDLEFEYTGLSLVAPARLTFEYRLDGYENGWQQAGTRRVAYYANLPPGRYRLRVRATSQAGLRSEQEATLSFRLSPFFWQTPAFLALCALGGVALAGTAYGARVRLLQRRQAELIAHNQELARALKEAEEAVRLKVELLRESKIRDSLSRYFSPEIVTMISSADGLLSVRGRRQEVTVVFIDIDDFTPLTERLEVGKMVELLNEFFSLVTEIVFRHQGIVDKFLGDAVMALFGAPTALPQSPELAVKAAREVRAALEDRAPDWQARFGETLRVSIGINYGEVIIGNIGSDRRLEYTAIGDTVNVAARLQSMAEANQILVGEEVERRLTDRQGVERLGEQALRGRDRKITIYSVN